MRITDNASKVYRVPYAGFWGDYQLIRVLAPGACSFPGLFRLGGQTVCAAGPPPAVLGGATKQVDGAVFNVEDQNDRPLILFHLAHQSRQLVIEAIHQGTNERYSVASFDYLARDATAGGINGYIWDGKQVFGTPTGLARRKEVPAGAYRLKVSVTKALADPAIPAHTEIWDSPLFSIVRNN